MLTVAANFRRTQPKSIGLVWGLTATRRSICIHQMNQVNSRNDFGHDDIVVALLLQLLILKASLAKLVGWI